MKNLISKTSAIATLSLAIIATASIFFSCNKDNENEFNDKTTRKSLCLEVQKPIAIADAKVFETSEIECFVSKDELKEFFENKSQIYLGEQISLIDFQIIDYEIANPDHQPFCEIAVLDQYSNAHTATTHI